MDFKIQTKISNFIENQFPNFYHEEGPNFIQFVKAYYEWLEEDGNILKESRNILNYRDIDNTLETFLQHFQKKYLYGIPFNVIINKRYLLKHILDVYRSKSSIQCYKLLFRLIYDEDIEVYLPGRDIIRASDGTWIEPRYIEVSYANNLSDYIGKQIIGSYSNTRAVVENYIQEYFDEKTVNILYISNITPKNGEFEIGERLTVSGEESNNITVVLGSLYNLEIINGGQQFEIGDILKIPRKNLSNNLPFSGKEGIIRIESLSKGVGSLYFSIYKAGQGYSLDANTFVYKTSANGTGADFNIGSIRNAELVEYNTDILCDYVSKQLDDATFGFPANTSANASSNIGDVLSYDSKLFGSIATLTNINTGNSYIDAANTFVRSFITSNLLHGNLTYTTSSNTVTGTNSNFTAYIANNDVIMLQANSSNNNSKEYQVVKEVVNTTSMILYGPPAYNSTVNARYAIAPTIYPSNFAVYENLMYNLEGDIFGENEIIKAIPSSIDNKIVNSVKVIDSGKGYIEGEEIEAYLYGAVSNSIQIVYAGNNYTNGDLLVFTSQTGSGANGYVVTNSSGSIVNTVLTYAGSGYFNIPTIRVKTTTGNGAYLTTTLLDYNQTSKIIGRVIKSGLGKSKGYWSTTQGFLNSDKKIQDSYYYQDYSYEIRVAQTLNKYRDILYDTFHIAGTELFGEYLKIDILSSNSTILYESNTGTLS